MFSSQLSKLIRLRYAGNVARFSREIGKRESVIRNWLRGAQPRLADVVHVSLTEHVSLAWLALGHGAEPGPRRPGRAGWAHRLLRVRGNIERETFARFVDLSAATIRAIESGEFVPDAGTLRHLADRVNLHWLITGEGPRDLPEGEAGPRAPAPEAERLLSWIVADERGEFSDRLRAAAADDLRRLLLRRTSADEEPDPDARD